MSSSPRRPFLLRDLPLALAWVGLIFLCMYYGRSLGPWFRGDRAVWAMAFLAACGLVFVAWLAWRIIRLPAGRRLGRSLGALACLAGLGLLAWWQPLLIERSHLMLYGVLGILAWRVAGGCSANASRFLWAALGCLLVGLGDEVAQYYHPQRVFDLRDVVTNTLSAWLAMAAMALIYPERRHSC